MTPDSGSPRRPLKSVQGPPPMSWRHDLVKMVFEATQMAGFPAIYGQFMATNGEGCFHQEKLEVDQ